MRKILLFPVLITIAVSCGKEIVTEEVIKEVLVEAEAKLSVSCLTGSPSEITPTSATVSGIAAIVNAKDTKVAVCFYYSSDMPSGSEALKDGSKADAGYLDKSGGSFELTIGDLTPETTYYYTAAVSVDGQEFFGKVESFVTLATPRELVTTGSATDVSVCSVTLSGFANLPAGIDDAQLGILCSKDKDQFDGGVVLVSDGVDANLEYKVTASGLSSDTEYFYQAFVRYSDADGTVSRYGETLSFKTRAVDAVAQTMDAKDVSEHNATLCATLSLYVNEELPVSAYFLLGKGVKSLDELLNEGTTYLASVSSDGIIERDVKDLESGEDYSYTVLVQVYDKAFFGEVKTMTLADVTTVKTVGAKRIQYTLATVSGLLYVDGNKQVNKKAGFLYSSSYASADGLKANGIATEAVFDGESFVGQLTGLEYGSIYYYLAYAEVNGRKVYADEVKELTPSPVPEGTVYLETVCKGTDGLLYEVYWATCNLSENGFVSSPEQYGDYYAWGETTPYYSSQDPLTWKDGKTGYDWASYKWCNGSYSTLTRYNINTSYGIVDDCTEFSDYDYADDAARQTLGGKWRVPTNAEWTELRTQCTLTWTTENGVNGRRVIGPNGNSIFLPAAGYRFGTRLNFAGSRGLYWSSSLSTDYPNGAWYVNFSSDAVDRYYYNRYYGQSVRPVSE